MNPAAWDISVSLPPDQSLVGILLANLLAFPVPLALAVSCGLGFAALEASFYNVELLTPHQKQSGTVVLVVVS